MKISATIKNIINESNINNDNNILTLPDRKLSPKEYKDFKKVMELAGAKWNRKHQGFLFEKSPHIKLNEFIKSGKAISDKKIYQFFETPELIVKEMIEYANISNHHTVLEPSAGKGAIAKHISQCDCIELNEDNRNYLIENGFNVVGEDFLQENKEYDIIIANPPFSKKKDIEHTLHMINLAKVRVVSIMSASILFNTDKKTENFKNILNGYHHQIIELPSGAFKTSGTMVKSVIVIINKRII